MKKNNFILLLLFLLIFSGCGLRSVVVPNLDWLITRQVSEKLSLEGQQKQALQKDVILLLEDSKPQVQQIKQKLETLDLESANVFKMYAEFRSEYESFVKKLSPLFAKYLGQLNTKQIESFIEKNEEDNKRIEGEIKNAKSKALESYEKFLGKLSPQQEQLISMNSQIFIELKQQRLQRRKDYQKKLYSILTSNEITDRKQKISKITLQYNSTTANDSARQKSLHLLKEVLGLSTPKQKEFFKQTIKDDYLPWVESFLTQDFS